MSATQSTSAARLPVPVDSHRPFGDTRITELVARKQSLYLRAERIVGNTLLGKHALRFSIATRTAKVGLALTRTRFTGWLNSTKLHFSGETPVGPTFVGFSYSTGSSNAYEFIDAL